MSLPMPQLIDCVAHDRDPTIAELLDVAGRIWVEAGVDRSAFAWGRLPPASDDRALAVRAALVALRGVERG